MAAHRYAGQAERQRAGAASAKTASARAPPVVAVGHDADLMAARCLRARKIDHVAEQTADRRAQDMEDLEGTNPHIA